MSPLHSMQKSRISYHWQWFCENIATQKETTVSHTKGGDTYDIKKKYLDRKEDVMRKLLFLTLLSLVAIGLFAQDITIGNPNASTGTYAPVYAYFRNTVSQMIYTPAELSAAGFIPGSQITHVKFQAHVNIALATATTWQVRMSLTNATSMSSWIDPTGATLVFNGNIGVANLAEGAWLDLTLSAPFVYNGGQNLLIQVNETDYQTSYGNYNEQFRGTATTGNLTRYYYVDGSQITPTDMSTWSTGTATDIRPNTRFTVIAPTLNVPNLAITSFTGPVSLQVGDVPMNISVMNLGTGAQNSYTLGIYEVGGNPAPLYTIPPADIVPLPDAYDTHTYTIPFMVYRNYGLWNVGFGNVTLEARITSASDENAEDDTKQFTTYNQPDKDIEVVSVSGFTMFPPTNPLIITLKNNGVEGFSAAGYEVKLYEVTASGDVEITATIAEVALSINATANVEVPVEDLTDHDYAGGSTITYKAVVTLSGDQVPGNNSATHEVTRLGAIIEIGLTGTTTAYMVPFDTYYMDSLVQSIYTAVELEAAGFESGMITHIQYKLNLASLNNTAAAWPVNVYMANVTKPNGFTGAGDWIAGNAFTPVLLNYDLFTDFRPLTTGVKEIWLPLTTPFVYSGGDLAIMTYTDHSSYISSDSVFSQTPNYPNTMTLWKHTDNSTGSEYDPANPSAGSGGGGTAQLYKPQIRIGAFTNGSTNGPEMVIRSLTGPELIPADPAANIVLSVTNMSIDEDAEPEDYSIEIYEVVPGDDDYLLYTIDGDDANDDDTNGLITVLIEGGAFVRHEFEIPGSIFNGWDYQRTDAGAITLKVKVVYPGDNTLNEATFTTNLRAAYGLAFSDINVPMMIPTEEPPLSIKVQNTGRAVIDAESYKIEIIEMYSDAGTQTENVLYTIFEDTASQTDEEATEIALGDIAEYTFDAIAQNAWAWENDYVANGGAFEIKIRLTDTHGASDEVIATQSFQSRKLRPAVDLEVVSFTGPSMVPGVASIRIQLQNNGRSAIVEDGYTVVIRQDDAGGDILWSTAAAGNTAPAIGLGESETIVLPCQIVNNWDYDPFGADGIFGYYLVASIANDAITNNNYGDIDSKLIDTDLDAIAEIGAGGTSSQYYMPFDQWYMDSLTQMVYTSEDLGGLAAGMITQLTYNLTIASNNNTAGSWPVNLYMANYDKSAGFATTSDWVPGDAFVPVLLNYDFFATIRDPQGTVPLGTFDITIPLDTPFLYLGNGLVIMSWTDHSSYVSSSNLFLTSPNMPVNMGIWKHSDTQPASAYNPANPAAGGEGTLQLYRPYVRMGFMLGDFGILSGVVTDGTAPIAGVEISQNAFTATSAATTGAYSIFLNKESDTPLSFLKEGYEPKTITMTQLSTLWSTPAEGLPTATYNVEMTAYPAITVTGVVKYGDSGDFAGGLTVRIGTQTGTTDATTGEYSVTGVYPEWEYTLTVTVPSTSNYESYVDEHFIIPVPASGTTHTNDPILLEEKKPAPGLVMATLMHGGNREVSWYKPGSAPVSVTHGLYDPSGGNYYYNDILQGIVAHKYSAARISSLGLGGGYLTSLTFATASVSGTVSIVIWTGANLTSPDVNNPTYEQQIVGSTLQASTAGLTWNTVELTQLVPVPTDGDMMIGLKSTAPASMQTWTYDANVATYDGAGNIVWLEDAGWTTVFILSGSGYRDDWAIRSTFLTMRGGDPVSYPEFVDDSASFAHTTAPQGKEFTRTLATADAEDPVDPVWENNTNTTREFNNKYNIYRLAEGATFDPAATPLNGANPLVDTASHVIYLDETVSFGNYRYVVTCVYDGELYTDLTMSAPAYSNYLDVQPSVYGSVTRTNGTMAGYKVKLEAFGTGTTQTEIITGADGLFRFTPPAGTYGLWIQMSGTDGEGNPYDIYQTPEGERVGFTLAANYTFDPVDMTSLGDKDDVVIPKVTALKGNYPNPFNPTTTIAFDMAKDGQVSIDIYNIKGQKVRALTNEKFVAGSHRVVWNGDDAIGRNVGSGVYFYRMTTDGYSKTQKMLLLK